MHANWFTRANLTSFLKKDKNIRLEIKSDICSLGFVSWFTIRNHKKMHKLYFTIFSRTKHYSADSKKTQKESMTNKTWNLVRFCWLLDPVWTQYMTHRKCARRRISKIYASCWFATFVSMPVRIAIDFRDFVARKLPMLCPDFLLLSSNRTRVTFLIYLSNLNNLNALNLDRLPLKVALQEYMNDNDKLSQKILEIRLNCTICRSI